MAHVHGVRRLRCGSTGGGCHPIRTLGRDAAMSMPHVPRLEHRIKAQAYGLGFDLAGIAPLGIADSADAFDDWVARGYAGDMQYLERRAECGATRDGRSPERRARWSWHSTTADASRPVRSHAMPAATTT